MGDRPAPEGSFVLVNSAQRLALNPQLSPEILNAALSRIRSRAAIRIQRMDVCGERGGGGG